MIFIIIGTLKCKNGTCDKVQLNMLQKVYENQKNDT